MKPQDRGGASSPTPALVALIAAKAVSDIGFALDFVCLSVFAWVRTESAQATAALSLCVYAGGVAGGRLGQRYGAGWNRRRAMVLADVARLVALLLLAAVPGSAQLWVLFAAVFVVGAGRSVFEATLSAATPALAGSRTQAVNSVLSALKGLALAAGMGLAIVAVPAVGFRGVFALDAASYGLSAVALLVLPLRLRADAPATAPVAARGRGWIGLAGGGLAGGLAALVVVRGLDAMGSASHHVGLPVISTARDAAHPTRVVGTVWMIWAVGTLVGSLVVRPLLSRLIDRSVVAVFGAATALMSAGFIGIFWAGPWSLMLAAAAVAGLGDALSEITFKQALQSLPEAARVGAFSTASMVVNVGFAVGLVAIGAVATPGRIAGLVLLLHGIPLVAACGTAVWFRRALPAASHRSAAMAKL